MTDKGNPEKSISESLETVLAQLSTDQIRFVIARQEFATDKEAAEAIGIKPDTVYHWPDIVREAVRLMVEDGMVTALHLRRRNLAKAMMVKIRGLDSKREQTRQGVATEIIEWEMGKAMQRETHEHTGADGGPIELRRVPVEQLTDDELDTLVAIAERLQPATDGASPA